MVSPAILMRQPRRPRHMGLCWAEGHGQRANMRVGGAFPGQRANMRVGGPFPAPDDNYTPSALGDRWIGRDPAAPGGDKPVLELRSQTLSTSKAIFFIVGAFGCNSG